MAQGPLVIGGKKVGLGAPVFVIAEAGANFRISSDPKANFSQALKLIDIAVDARADAVKFQLYRADKLYVKDAGNADYIGKKSIYEIIKEAEFPYEWLPRLHEYCKQKGILFFASPFDIESVDELEKIDVPLYKVASYSITDYPLLKRVAKTGKPIILSTGASDLPEVKDAVAYLKECGNSRIVVLQCTAKYPAPLETVNLKAMVQLQKSLKLPVGLSDHSRDPLIAPLGAVALGASVIEKHYTTDNSLPGPDHGFAVLPHELKAMVQGIRGMESALGASEKRSEEAERELRQFARHSLFTTRPIKEGEAFSMQNIASLRPGKRAGGLEPKFFDRIVGKKAMKDIGAQVALRKEMVRGFDDGS